MTLPTSVGSRLNRSSCRRLGGARRRNKYKESRPYSFSSEHLQTWVKQYSFVKGSLYSAMAGGRKGGRQKKSGGKRDSAATATGSTNYDVDGDADDVEVAGTEREWVPSAAAVDADKQAEVETPEDEFGAKDFRSQMQLRQDHGCRPLWVAPNGHVFLETFSPVYRHAHDFLIAISEPVCRPEFIHEYKLTSVNIPSYSCVSGFEQWRTLAASASTSAELPSGLEEKELFRKYMLLFLSFLAMTSVFSLSQSSR